MEIYFVSGWKTNLFFITLNILSKVYYTKIYDLMYSPSTGKWILHLK